MGIDLYFLKAAAGPPPAAVLFRFFLLTTLHNLHIVVSSKKRRYSLCQRKQKSFLRYPKYQNIIDQYLSLDEFEEKAVETMRSKRVTVTTFCNYLGDQGIESINLCLQKHVVGFMENISSLST